MKVIISQRQFNVLLEQSDYAMDKRGNALAYSTGIRNKKDYESVNKFLDSQKIDPHTMMTILQIGTAFIPVAGVFISAGLGLIDAGMYYNEGDKKTAGLTAVFSMLPFISKIPGVKELGSKGMALLASKLGKGGANLTKAEIEIANAIKHYAPDIQAKLSKMAPKLKSVVKELDLYKSNYIKKYGEEEYNRLITKYLYDGIDKPNFIQTLKNVKSPNIKIKPILGGGADHRVYQSAVYPDRIIKVEVRPGEVDKWYDLFSKNKDVFAKTFNKSKVKNPDGSLLSAVVMEKLDTSKFMSLWDAMEPQLGEFQSKLGPSNQQNLEYLVKHIKSDTISEIKWNKFIPYFKQKYPHLSGKIDEFNKIIENLYKITPNPDIRKFNLGYDKNGVLKALDI